MQNCLPGDRLPVRIHVCTAALLETDEMPF
jgi:hypothetical protein